MTIDLVFLVLFLVSCIARDGAREEMLGGQKLSKCRQRAKQANVFTDHTFLIGSKFDKTP